MTMEFQYEGGGGNLTPRQITEYSPTGDLSAVIRANNKSLREIDVRCMERWLRDLDLMSEPKQWFSITSFEYGSAEGEPICKLRARRIK